MSDELIDGRDLRNRRPIRDDDADAAENEVQEPVVRSSHPEDGPSGPYVVLRPPSETDTPQPTADASTQPPSDPPAPPARVTLKPEGRQEYVPHFHTPTGAMPPIVDEDTRPTRTEPEPRIDLSTESLPASPSTRTHRAPDDSYIPMLHTPTGELPPVRDDDVFPVGSPTGELEPVRDDDPLPVDSLSEPDDEITPVGAQTAILPSVDDDVDFMVGAPTETAAPAADESSILDLMDTLRDDSPAEPDFIPMLHTPTAELPPVPDLDPPAATPSPDQIMRLPRIKTWDEDSEPAEPPAIIPDEPRRTEPEPTRPSVSTEALPRPDLPDFIPMLHTPTGELPPIEDDQAAPVGSPYGEAPPIDDAPSEDDPFAFIPFFGDDDEAPDVDEQSLPRPRPLQELYTSSSYEIITGEFDDLNDYVEDMSKRIDALRDDAHADVMDRPVRSKRATAAPSEQFSAIYEAVRKSWWRALPLLFAVIAIIALAVFVQSGTDPNTADTSPTPRAAGSAPATTPRATQPQVVVPSTEETQPAITPTAGPSPTPLAPYAQGRIAFASNQDGDFDIYVKDMITSQQTAITDNPASDRFPAWSPDGSRIIFSSDLAGTADLYVMNADGSNLTQVTTSDADDHAPAWSPDGGTILFSREDINGSALAKLNLDCLSAGDPAACESSVVLLTEQRYDLSPRWSADGSRIIFAASDAPGQPPRIAFVDPFGGSFSQLTGTDSSDSFPALSPDAMRIAFVSYRQGDDDVWLMGIDGSGVIQVTSNPSLDTSPVWSPDGAFILFASDRSPTGDFDLYLLDVSCLPDAAACEQTIRPITNDSADSLDPAWTATR